LPDLSQPRFFSNTAATHNDPIRCAGVNPLGAYVDDGLECDAQIQNQLGGNKSLQPEKSRQVSLGFVLEPNEAISVGIDYFRVQRKNSLQAVSDTTAFDYYGVLDPLNAQGRFVRYSRLANGNCSNDNLTTPTPANVPCAINYAVQVQENVGAYTVSGADASVAYRLGLGRAGKLRSGFDGTLVQSYKYHFAKGGPVTNNTGRFTSDNGAVPRCRGTTSANWNLGPWGATFSQNFVAGYKDKEGDRRVGSVETYDIQGQWTGIKGLTLVLGVRNIFDRYPPASNQDQSFQVGYDPRYGDPFGRLYRGRISYLFK
jgi:iron complex outermembrane receptor protein